MRPFPSLLLLVALHTGAALASQYPLDQARQIIPPDDARRLQAIGIETTLELLTHGHDHAGRRDLAVESGITLAKIEAWVALADLMRVRGIGPDVARLLTAVGVRNLAALQQADSRATAAAIVQINRKLRLSTNPPGAASIAFWIEEAKTLPVVLE